MADDAEGAIGVGERPLRQGGHERPLTLPGQGGEHALRGAIIRPERGELLEPGEVGAP